MFSQDLQPVPQQDLAEDLEHRFEDEAMDGPAPPRGRSFLKWAVGLATVCLAGAALSGSGSHSVAVVPAAGERSVTSLATTMCAAPGTNCKASGCCQAGGKNGFQCFEKDDSWSDCLESCEPGVHPGEKEGTFGPDGQFKPAAWSCSKIGERSERDPCSAPGEDCRSTKCCSGAMGGQGMSCFEKDENWASCRDTCDGDDWSCKALGNRTKFPPGCSWAGQSCADTKLCCNRGFECVVKDALWTACTQTVKKTTWVTDRIPIPGDWQGTIVGGGRDECSVPAAAEDQPVASTSLYCFMAYLPDSYEVGLYWEAFNTKSSIFACDGYDSFHAWQSAKAGWDTGEATLSNTDVFINVWDNMIKLQRYLDFDWTVKVDADALLIPGRLKQHLAALRPPAYRPIYIKNNDMDPGMGNSGFLGAIEVFSKQAVQIYSDNAEGCRQSLGIDAGEDGYFKGCMDSLGIGYMKDPELFFPDRSPGACSQGQRAGFHPLKSPKDWRCCLDISNGIMHNVEYGHCIMVYPVPAATATPASETIVK